MGSSIQLPSQRQVGTTHTILQVGPFLPTYRTMRIVLERDPCRGHCKWSAQILRRRRKRWSVFATTYVSHWLLAARRGTESGNSVPVLNLPA